MLNKPQEAKSLRNPGFDAGAGDGPIVGHAPDLTASFLLDKRENCGVKPGPKLSWHCGRRVSIGRWPLRSGGEGGPETGSE
jgi:hypothetical protein